MSVNSRSQKIIVNAPKSRAVKSTMTGIVIGTLRWDDESSKAVIREDWFRDWKRRFKTWYIRSETIWEDMISQEEWRQKRFAAFLRLFPDFQINVAESTIQRAKRRLKGYSDIWNDKDIETLEKVREKLIQEKGEEWERELREKYERR